MNYIRHVWSQARWYRVLLVAVTVFVVLRLGMQVVLITTPDLFPDDLRLYLEAANAVRAHQPLYASGDIVQMELYQYTPLYALLFVPFTWVPPTVAAAILSLIHLAIYYLLYASWMRVFRRLRMERASEIMAWTLPVWLIFSEFWSDLGYLNFYILMALLGTLFIDAILDERLGPSVLWLSIILQMKPQWAFAAAVPLLLGRYKFFARLVGLAAIAYLALMGGTILLLGPAYGWAQYQGYYGLLATLSRLSFKWRTLADGFFGYNHSVAQIVIYFLGDSPAVLRLVALVKAALLLPVAIVAVRALLRPARCAGADAPRWCMDLAFALYLGAFIWLDQVWEVSLGIAIFVYLLATVRSRPARAAAWIVFMVYALLDLIRIVSFALAEFGGLSQLMVPGPYILSDPAVWLPVTMFVILLFYGLLIGRLWRGPAAVVAGQTE